jgi:ABC-type transport system involved in cytochrome bd biosynthesis fused ATPase/permease subunit
MDIEKTYFEYLGEANRLHEEYMRVYRPYSTAAMALLIAGLLLIFFSPKSNAAGVGVSSWMYYLCLIASIVISMIGSTKGKKITIASAAEIAASKVGFSEFYLLYLNGRWWPNKMVTGKKYDKFLEIIQQKPK